MIDLDRHAGDRWARCARLPINRDMNYAVRIEPGDAPASP